MEVLIEMFVSLKDDLRVMRVVGVMIDEGLCGGYGSGASDECGR